MTKEEINKLAEFVEGDHCSFSRDEIVKALTYLDMKGTYLGRQFGLRQGSGSINADLCSSIDEAIEYLIKLKEEGWTEIDTEDSFGSGSDLSAYKPKKEPDEDYRDRLLEYIERQLRFLDSEYILQEINNKKKEIAELESMLKQD